MLCFGCEVEGEFEKGGMGVFECVSAAGGCVEGDQDICTGFEEVSHRTGTILNPPAGPVGEDLDLCSLSASTHNSS